MLEQEKTFIRNLNWLMQHKGLNQSSLEAEAGVSQQVMSRLLEVGRGQKKTLEKLASYFGLTADDLYDSGLIEKELGLAPKDKKVQSLQISLRNANDSIELKITRLAGDNYLIHITTG